jgi:uncharacterized YigZ family protein
MTNLENESQSEPDAQPQSYRTVAVPGQAEIKIQRSRFLATVAPAPDLAATKTVVAEVANRHHDCRHVCYAWRGGIGRTLQEVRNDGGEPAGTAGEPILVALRRADLTDSVAVVARYFGGIKLGTGGLARAYGQAVEAALQKTTIHKILLGNEYTLAFPYQYQKTIRNLVTRHGGRIVKEAYGSLVDWRIWLPVAGESAFTSELTTATAGQIKLNTIKSEGPDH